MNIKNLLAPIVLLLGSLSLNAQTTREEFYADPMVFPGYHYPYHGGTAVLTPAPKGYEPFYIYHFGRHGSRFDIEPEHPGKCIEVLETAAKAGMLTSDGEELLELVRRIADYNRGREGELSPVGQKEHEKIAERMFNNFKDLFSADDVKVVARSSDSPRCIVSMASFCGQLRAMNPMMLISLDCASKYHFYIKNASGAKIRAKDYKKPIAEYAKAHPYNVDHLVGMVFKPGYRSSLKEDGQSFMRHLLSVYKYLDCNGFGREPMDKYFTDDDRYANWLQSTYYFYVKYGPSLVSDKLLVGAAHEPVEHFRYLVDEAIAGRGPAANLQFSHDSFVLPFAALLNIDGADAKEADPEKVSLIFSDYKRVPMAVNLQFVFYRNTKNDVIFKILYNEAEVAIPGVKHAKIGSVNNASPYYRWSEIQSYIDSRLELYPAPIEK